MGHCMGDAIDLSRDHQGIDTWSVLSTNRSLTVVIDDASPPDGAGAPRDITYKAFLLQDKCTE